MGFPKPPNPTCQETGPQLGRYFIGGPQTQGLRAGPQLGGGGVEGAVSPQMLAGPRPTLGSSHSSPSCGVSGLRGPGSPGGGHRQGGGQPLKAGVQRHKKKPRGPQEQAGGQEAERPVRLEARRPLDGRSFRRPHCLAQLRGGPGRTPGSAPTAGPPASCRPCLRAACPAGVPAGASVVGERVPQEDEDQDDAGGGQRGARDVE